MTPDCDLAMPDEGAAVRHSVVWRILMKLAREVSNSINCALVLAYSFIVPFYAEPNVGACLWVVNELARVTDAAVGLPELHSLTKEVSQ